MLEEGIKRYVPSKVARKRNSQPWIKTELRRLINKRNRWFQKARKSGKEQDHKKYRELKAMVQKNMRRSYWRYVEELITPGTDGEGNTGNNKRFWIFIEHAKQDTTGVAPLLLAEGKIIEDPTR